MSFGGTETHDHHVLIMGHILGIDVKYSRCPKGLEPLAIWDYYSSQILDAFGEGYILFHVIDDLDHVHPRVLGGKRVLEYHDNNLDAHMP